MQQNVNLPERAAEYAKARREIYGQERVWNRNREPSPKRTTHSAMRI